MTIKQFMVVVRVGRETYYTVATADDEKKAESHAARLVEKMTKAGCVQAELAVWDTKKIRAADGEVA